MRSVIRYLSFAALATAPLWAQTLVVDRELRGSPQSVRIERHKGAVADAFRFGTAGEVWMIERVRLWAMPAAGPACGKELGDSIEKITLEGALDNPPVPGQPVCDCHALVPLATASFANGSSAPAGGGVVVTRKSEAWELDFANVRWSVPADSDVLFTVRATPRPGTACPVERQWALAGGPAPDYRLHLLNEKGVPEGLEEPVREPRQVRIQVWARKTR